MRRCPDFHRHAAHIDGVWCRPAAVMTICCQDQGAPVSSPGLADRRVRQLAASTTVAESIVPALTPSRAISSIVIQLSRKIFAA